MQIWFPQIEDKNSNSNVLFDALRQFNKLFLKDNSIINACLKNIKTDKVKSKHSLDYYEDLVDNYILKENNNLRYPFYILGTSPDEDVVLESYKELGLNLFDLPWGNSFKAFRYVQITNLKQMLKTDEIEEIDEKYSSGIKKEVEDNLKWFKENNYF